MGTVSLILYKMRRVIVIPLLAILSSCSGQTNKDTKTTSHSEVPPAVSTGPIETTRGIVYFSADNVKTFDDYPGYTPESNSYGNETTQPGVDYSTYPLAKKYTIGISITF